MKLTMTVRFNVTENGPSTAEDLESFLDGVIEELLRLDGIEDSTVSASLSKRIVTIMVTVDAPSPEGAAAIGMTSIRTAFHAAGAATPDWPTFHDLAIGTDLVGADQ